MEKTSLKHISHVIRQPAADWLKMKSGRRAELSSSPGVQHDSGSFSLSEEENGTHEGVKKQKP